MIEVTATIIITASSVLLFGYWFRYTCLLILSAKTTRDYAADIATANQLSFLEIQAQLSAGIAQNFDGLSAALNRDYATLRSMMESAAAGEDIYPWGFAKTRHELEVMLHYAHRQGVTPRKYEPEDLFWSSMLET